MKTWRCKELLAEARANLTARPAAAAFLMLAALGVCMSSGLTDMSAARSVEHYDTTLVLDGYTTVKVTSARTGGSLSGPMCASFEGTQRELASELGVGVGSYLKAGSAMLRSDLVRALRERAS